MKKILWMGLLAGALGLVGCDGVEYQTVAPPVPATSCGDGVCQLSELGASTCPEDCEDAAGNVCGDRRCGPDEDCPADCDDAPDTICGDGRCDDGESETRCPTDCAETKCGDGVCNDGEVRTCPIDCEICGNGACEGSEDPRRCPEDCGFCGDGFCGPGESTRSCGEDCGGFCGDGICDGAESPRRCPEDCRGGCGNGVCDRGESQDNCPEDCFMPPPDCGDGMCGPGENPFNCPDECEVNECRAFELPPDNGCPDPAFGTCFPIDDQTGVCLASGELPSGSICSTDNPDAFTDECAANGVCVPDRPDGRGTCRALCRSFVLDADSGCEPGEACAIVGDTVYGYCTDEVTDTPIPPLEPCPTPQQWCGDHSICLEVDAEGNSLCIVLCRLNLGDGDCPAALGCEDIIGVDGLGVCVPP